MVQSLIRMLQKVIFPVVAILIVGIALLFFREDDTELEQMSANLDMQMENNEHTDFIIMVDIKGEVENPGIYECHEGDRIHDIIQMAGGFTNQADERSVNLAQRVQDEMSIIVEKKGQEMTHANSVNDNQKINLNTADTDELESLNGIGKSKAEAIIKYREENGYFSSIDDLLNVSGIGEKTFENIQEDIQAP